MTIIIRVEGATKWNTSKTIPLNTLYLMGSKGADNVNSEIGMCGKFLQRKLQTLLWQLDGAQRAKEYISQSILGSISSGNGIPCVEPFAAMYREGEKINSLCLRLFFQVKPF